MKIRSVTCFLNAGQPEDTPAVHAAGELAQQARHVLESSGLAVQTTRLATQPLSQLAGDPLHLADDLWQRAATAGFDYLSLGPVLADSAGANVSKMDVIPDLLRSTDTVFASVLVAGSGRGIHLAAIRRMASIVREVAHTTDLGFGNLRLAMLANVPPHSPFFPAAYHDGGAPALGIATESADLAVEAFSGATSLEEARARLVAAVEEAAGRISSAIRPLAERLGYRFAGIDFSLAPYPEKLRSIGAAIEGIGVNGFGAAGTLFVASLLTDALRRARFPRCGFSGLMLPVLEDATLAERSNADLFTVNDLLLYCSVCGTGLDTVPLPGNVDEPELAGILLDVAALAVRLDKPLTARLMPVPGAKAGDVTTFDFPYFANGRVLQVKGHGSQALFERGDWLAM